MKYPYERGTLGSVGSKSSKSSGDQPSYQPALTVYLEAPDDWAVLKSLVEKHPELLADAAAHELEEHVHSLYAQDKTAKAAKVHERGTFLFRCREIGVDRAYQAFSLQLDADAPAELQHALQELVDRQQPDLGKRISRYIAALALLDRDRYPYLYGVLQHELGCTLNFTLPTDRVSGGELAIDAFRKSLTVRSLAETPLERMDSLCGLARAYLRYPKGTRADNLEHAVAAYQEAFATISKVQNPKRWGDVCILLARVYLVRIAGCPEANVEQALALTQEALQVHDASRFPTERAEDQVTLGQVYLARRSGDPVENFERANEAAESPMGVLSVERNPFEYAALLRLLAAILIRAEQFGIAPGEDDENTDAAMQAIDMLKDLPELYKHIAQPGQYTSTLNQLAGAYCDREKGEPAENIEAAIQIYSQVESSELAQFCRDEWAQALYGLARCYSQRERGDAADNEERTLHFANQAAAVFAEQQMNDEVGRVKLLLANQNQSSAQADEEKTREAAIVLLEDGLRLLRHKADPDAWANGVQLLAALYGVSSDSASSTAKSIQILEQALAVISPQSQPQAWAELRLQLAAVYIELSPDERGDQIERALSLLPPAVPGWDKADEPDQWAQEQFLLARAFGQRQVGKKLQNLQHAVQSGQKALTVYTAAQYPEERAEVLTFLAEVYQSQHAEQSDPAADSMERAIAALREARKLCERADDKAGLALSLNQLAMIYLTRVTGDRENNLEESIHFAEQGRAVAASLDVTAADSAYWLLLLAEAYEQRLRGVESENLDHAITLHEEAYTIYREAGLFVDAAECVVAVVRVGLGHPLAAPRNVDEVVVHYLENARGEITQEKSPAAWALLTSELADCYMKRRLGALGENEAQAIALLQQSLTVYTREHHPEKWVQTKLTIGLHYRMPPLAEQPANIEQGIAAIEDALAFLDKDQSPAEWSSAMVGLGYLFAARTTGDRAANRQRAVDSLRQAVESRERRHQDLGKVAVLLGITLIEQGQIEDGVVWLQRSIQELQRACQEASWRGEGPSAFESASQDYCWIAQGLAQAGRLREAVAVLELSRARTIGDILTREQSERSLSAAKNPAAYSRYMRAAMRLRNLENQQLNTRLWHRAEVSRTFMANLHLQLQRAHEELTAAVDRLRELPEQPALFPEPSWEDCAAAVAADCCPEGVVPIPVVYLVPLDKGCMTLILRPAATRQAVRPQLILSNQLSSRQTMELIFDMSVEVDRDAEARGYLAGAFWQATGQLEAGLEKILPVLGEQLMSPVAQALRGEFDSLVLIPCSAFGLLPLHAVSYRVDGQPRRLIDELTVTYVPSARVLSSVRSAAARRGQTPTLVGIANPLPHSRPLTFARDELEALSLHFPPESRQLLFEREATKEAALQLLPAASHVHLSCHGTFDVVNPMRSALEMANEEPLTLHDILLQEPLEQTRLVVLSACNSAVIDTDNSSEGPNWPAAFLRLGVPGVVGLIWPAEAGATALLMAKFYELLLQGEGSTAEPLHPAQALGRAQRWLCALTWEEATLALGGLAGGLDRGASAPDGHPFSAPRYWAPFIFVGA